MPETVMRDRTKFNSDFSEWAHDHCVHNFYYSDIDGCTLQRGTRILRIMEYKHVAESLSDGQFAILRLMSQIIDDAIAAGRVSPLSGAFIVRADKPFVSFEITRLGQSDISFTLTEEKMKSWMSGS